MIRPLAKPLTVAMPTIYDQNLDSAQANYTPLNPTSFLTSAERVYCDHAAMIDGRAQRTWSQAATRCRCLAGALSATGIGTGNTVAGMAPNLPEVLKAHYDVPMIGVMLNLRNIRLTARWFWRSNKALVVLFLRMKKLFQCRRRCKARNRLKNSSRST